MDREIRRALAHKYNGMKQRCYNPKNSEYLNFNTLPTALYVMQGIAEALKGCEG